MPKRVITMVRYPHNARRKLYHDDRPRVLEALMHHRVLIPEGRSEYEWFRLLSDVLETGELALQMNETETPAFGTVVGVIPTHDGAVADTHAALSSLRSGLVPLVDGDGAGDDKVRELRRLEPVPAIILQWCEGWVVEDVIGWVLKGAEEDARRALQERIAPEFGTIDDLMVLFKAKTGQGRLKTDYLAYEEVASVIGDLAACRDRAAMVLDAMTKACLGQTEDCDLLVRDEGRSNDQSVLMRLRL